MKVLAILPALLLPATLCAQFLQPRAGETPPAASVPAQQPKQLTREEMMMMAWGKENFVGVIANVDGAVLTSYDLNKALVPVIPQMIQSAKSEGEFQRLMLEKASLLKETLSDQQLLISEFKDGGASVPPMMINAEVDRRIKENYNGDRAMYLSTLQRMGRTVLDDRRDIEEWMIVDHMRRRFYRSSSEISPTQIQKFYDENKELYRQSEAVSFRQITFYPGASQTDADVRAEAASAVAAAKSGTDFGELAKKYSKDDYRNDGGYAGVREMDKLNEKIAAALKSAPDGGVTEPLDLTLPGGRLTLFVFKREEYRAAGVQPVEDVRDDIEGRISADQRVIAQQELMERLKKKYFVRYY